MADVTNQLMYELLQRVDQQVSSFVRMSLNSKES